MTAMTDKKLSTPVDKKTGDSSTPILDVANSDDTTRVTVTDVQIATASFRDEMKMLDAQRAELVKNALDNLKPGRTFDSAVVRKVNKLETARNRLIVSHFARLLKHNPAEVHAIVHQIIEL